MQKIKKERERKTERVREREKQPTDSKRNKIERKL